MTADEALKFIHEKVWQGSRPGLSRTFELLSKMGNPQSKLHFIHIAGTNGKGSVAAMLAQIFQTAGLKTGLYTSPFITAFNERIQVNGQPISGDQLAAITEFSAPLALEMDDRPTEFELVTVIAFEHFKRENCEIVVLETGMGGRLDSTNVISAPLCSVIMNIGLDHTAELGDTLEKICAEKAGIIKAHCPTVLYDLDSDLISLIKDRCAQLSSPLFIADFSKIRSISDSLRGQEFSYKRFENLHLPLLGAHQLKNAAVALETLEVLRGVGIEISDAAIASGLEKTAWPARFEILSEKPFFILDGGHNPQCAETVAANLSNYFPNIRKVLLLGVLADKDYVGLAKTLNPQADAFVTIAPPSPRALPATTLANALRAFGKPVFPASNIDEGIKKAIELAGEEGAVCAVGSLYSAGAIRAYFRPVT